MSTGDEAPQDRVIDGPASRRGFLGLCAIGGIILGLGAQATGITREPSVDRSWRLLVDEAGTGESRLPVLMARYQSFAKHLESELRPSPAIAVEPVADSGRFLSLAQSRAKPELVFGPSANQLAKLVREEGYQPLVRRAPAGKVASSSTGNSPQRTGDWSVLASPALASTEIAELRAALLRMNAQAPQLLAALGIGQWAAAGRQEYLALPDARQE